MELNNVDLTELLKKYWNAETTIEEEKLLKQHFSNQEYISNHFDEASVFKAIIDTKDIDFDVRLKQRKPVRRLFLSGIAAALVMSLSGIFLWTHHQSENIKMEKEMAIHIKNELSTVSEMLNQSYSELNQSAENFTTINSSTN